MRLAHLIRDTSIISSSNPHKLTVQGEREAAPAGVHRVQALCWPQGLLPPPKGCKPHRGDCAFIPVLLAPPPSSLRSHSGPGSQAEHSASTARATPRRQQLWKVPQSAALPQGTDARPSLARSQTASPRGASLNPEKAQPRDDPTQGWRASQRWQKRFA